MLTRRTPYTGRASYPERTSYRGVGASVAVIVLVIWFAIGAIAAGQRHYFSSGAQNCAKVGTTIVTILAGPLNYLGANPQIHNCQTPQPSK